MKMAMILAGALALSASGDAAAGPYRHHPHPPPIQCAPPKVARIVEVVSHHYQRRHEWRCVMP